MFIFIIITGIIVIVALAVNIVTYEGEGGCIAPINTLAIICLFFIICWISIENTYGPKAIDVYKGNTTLQITYRDSIPIDSVVVFKSNSNIENL